MQQNQYLMGNLKQLNAHTQKRITEINNLNFYLWGLGNEVQISSKVSRRNKIRAEMNKIKNRKPVEKINETET